MKGGSVLRVYSPKVTHLTMDPAVQPGLALATLPSLSSSSPCDNCKHHH